MQGDPRSAADPAPTRHEQLAALLAAARDGDRGAFDELVVTLTPLLWHVARAQGLDRELAADVVQTTWVSLLRSLATIQNPAALTGWLVTVTRREAWRVRRRQLAEQTGDEQVLERRIAPAPAAEASVLDDDRRLRLWRAVGRLSPRCQELLRIVAFVERPSYGEVSRVLGMPAGSIGPTRGRCLAQLRQLLETEGEGGWR